MHLHVLTACPPERACACVSNYVLFECTALCPTLSSGSIKRGDMVTMDTIAQWQGKQLVQGGDSVGISILNVDPKMNTCLNFSPSSLPHFSLLYSLLPFSSPAFSSHPLFFSPPLFFSSSVCIFWPLSYNYSGCLWHSSASALQQNNITQNCASLCIKGLIFCLSWVCICGVHVFVFTRVPDSHRGKKS